MGDRVETLLEQLREELPSVVREYEKSKGVKLPKTRVDELVKAKIGKRLDPVHGRLMKEWLTVTSKNANWLELAREAHDYVK